MKEESAKQIKLGMLLSYINIGIGNLIPIFYTPIMLSLLGQSEYGLYKISSSTTSYLSLMAFGIGGAITRYLIKANADGGTEEEEKVFGLFQLMFQAITLLTLFIGAVLTINLPRIYGAALSKQELSRMTLLVGIMVVNTAVGFSATAYNAVVSSHEKFIFIQAINILSTIGVPIFNLLVLFLGYRSIEMAIVSLSIGVISRIIYVIYVRFAMQIRPRYKSLPFQYIKEIVVYSFWIFLSNVVGQLYNATDTVIIGTIPALATMGAAVYSVGVTFPNIMFSLVQVTPSLFSPMINRMVFSGSTNRELTDIMIKVGRMQCFIVSLICSGFVAFGKPFISFYAGESYSDAYWVAIIIMIPNCIPLVQSVAHSIIRAQNKHQFRSKVYLAMAVANVFATYLLVRKFGIIGAAIPTGLCYFLGNGLIMNWYYWKKIDLDIPRFWRSMLRIIVLSISLCLIATIAGNYVDYYVLSNLLLSIALYSIVYICALWIGILSDAEKEIVRKTLKITRK